MSGIYILIVIALNVPIFGTGIAFFVNGVTAARTQKDFYRQVAAMLVGYGATTVIYFSLLFSSKDAITSAGQSAEGGIVEIPMVIMFSLGAPFWILLVVAFVLLKAFSKSNLNRSLSSGVFLGIASFNYFIVLYGQKILETMGIGSGSMIG